MNQSIIDEIDSAFIVEEPSIEIVEGVVEEKDVEVIKLQGMADDLIYTIQKLRNNIDNSERLLNKLTLDMMQEEDDMDIDTMTIRYTALDAGMNKNLELLQKARKDISIVMANLSKAKNDKIEVKTITNNVTIEGGAISTSDIIAKLKGKD